TRLALFAVLLAPPCRRDSRHGRGRRVPTRVGPLRNRPRHLPARRQPHCDGHRSRPRASARRTRLSRVPRAVHHDRVHGRDTDAHRGIRAEVTLTYLSLTLPFLAIALAVGLAVLVRQPARSIRRQL